MHVNIQNVTDPVFDPSIKSMSVHFLHLQINELLPDCK